MFRKSLTVICAMALALTSAASAREVLLDGSKTIGMRPHKWKVGDGYIEVQKGKGGLSSEKKYSHYHLHVEWKPPVPAKGSSQGRGNSGVFMGRYEVQVLDCYQNKTYSTGQTGSVYGFFPPLVNACLPPEKWTTYDILWDAPLYQGKELLSPPRLTVFHNGVVIHHDTVLWGQFKWKDKWLNQPHGPENISFQNHGNPVRYRKIWVENKSDKIDPTMRKVDMARYMHLLTNQKWVMRDEKQPQPKIVTPGATPGAKPSDATALSSSSFRKSYSSMKSLKQFPDGQFHLEWKGRGTVKFTIHGVEVSLPSVSGKWNSTDLVFTKGKVGGTGYAIVTALHNEKFYQVRKPTSSSASQSGIEIKGRIEMRNAWIRALGIYAGYDANRPVITKYLELFKKSQR